MEEIVKANIDRYKISLGVVLREIDTKTKICKVVHWQAVKHPYGSYDLLI